MLVYTKIITTLVQVMPNFHSLYKLYSFLDERKLQDIEQPLFVQLNWGKDDREGRFLLKSEKHKTANVSPSKLEIVPHIQYCQICMTISYWKTPLKVRPHGPCNHLTLKSKKPLPLI